MATSKVSRLLITDLKRIISVFIREIYTFNVKEKHRRNSAWALSKKCMVQKIPRERISIWRERSTICTRTW